MELKCKIGIHSWDGCKCTQCNKIRDEQHDWNEDCEKCSNCGKIRENQHIWDGCICSKCKKKRYINHFWDDCRCTKCGETKDENHLWESCTCSKCDQIKDENHLWNDCTCEKCGATKDEGHKWENHICKVCGKPNDINHTWRKNDCSKCSKCGVIKIENHIWNDDNKCIKCGKEKDWVLRFWLTGLPEYLNMAEEKTYLNPREAISAPYQLMKKTLDTSLHRFPNQRVEIIGLQDAIAEYIIMLSKFLNVDKFRNGDMITEAKTNEEWENAGINNQPAWCYYKNSENQGEKFGKLYNGFAVNDARGLAPVGYHLPTESELRSLKSEYHSLTDRYNTWSPIEEKLNIYGTYKIFFSSLLTGRRNSDGEFYDLFKEANIWGVQDDNDDCNEAILCRLHLTQNDEYAITNIFMSEYKGNGYSVICIKD